MICARDERWTVKLDVRDLGGHLDTTYRVWSCTLAVLFFGLCGWSLPYRLAILVSFVFFVPCYIPAALHGIEASSLSQGSLFRLRAAFVRACGSSKLTLAHAGTVLGMLDGPEFVDPVACIVWFRFRLMRRYLAFRPFEAARIGRLLELGSGGAPGHGPVHLLVESASSLGFRWCSDGFCWDRPGLPQLPMIEGPYQHFQDSILGALTDLNAADLCKRKGFRSGPHLDFRGSMQLLDSSHVRDRDKALLRAILSGGVWNGFLLSNIRRQTRSLLLFFVGFGWGWSLVLGLFLRPLVVVRDSPEFHDIVSLDKAGWPRCFLWHGWLPALSGADGDAEHVASKRLEFALGSYVGAGRELVGLFPLVRDDAPLADAPDVWSDGSLVLDGFSGVGFAGCGVYAHCSGAAWFGRRWGTLIYFLFCLTVLVRLAGFIVLFLAPCRLCSVLRFGEFQSLCGASLVCMLVWIT